MRHLPCPAADICLRSHGDPIHVSADVQRCNLEFLLDVEADLQAFARIRVADGFPDIWPELALQERPAAFGSRGAADC